MPAAGWGGPHRQRRALTLLLLAAVGLTLGGVAVRHGHHRAAAPAATGRTQRTLLMQVAGDDGSAVDCALLAQDPADGSASVLFVPSRVVAQVPGHGSGVFGGALAAGAGTPGLSSATLTDLVGVSVDHEWDLTGAGFAALVDVVGGVDVDVDVDVTAPVPAGGTRTVVAAGAHQHLDGLAAAQLAGYVAPGETELARQPRLQAVLEGILARLPDRAQLAGQLQALPGSRSSWTPGGTADLLTSLTAVRARGDVSYSSLPTVPVETGGGPATYRLDQGPAAALVQRTLARSVPPGRLAGHNRVLVVNRVGVPGVGESAERRLVPRGFIFVGSQNAQQFADGPSQVQVFDRDPATLGRAQEAAAALGLPGSAVVVVADRNQTVADLIVVLGSDYRG